ncbi:MAG: hypothetical protein N2C12_12055, partial [Planctomycetales bacterium]
MRFAVRASPVHEVTVGYRSKGSPVYRLIAGVLALGMAVIASDAVAEQPLDVTGSFEELLPGMGADKIAESAEAQKQWEQICRRLCAPGMEDQRGEACRLMAARLDPETAAGARICMLRQLEYLGNAKCVDAVGTVLADKDQLVRSAALRALASNPAQSATTTLIDSLESAAGAEFKIGLLNALGIRKDPSATVAAVGLLDDPNEDIIAAAARMLGMIATPQAAEALKARRKASEGKLRLRLCNASLRCANNMIARNIDAAHNIFLQLVVEDISRPLADRSVRDAALHGMLTIAGPDELEFHLTDKIPGNARVAAAHIANLDGPGTKQLVGNLPKLPPASQVLVLQALAVRADKSVMPEVMAATEHENKT